MCPLSNAEALGYSDPSLTGKDIHEAGAIRDVERTDPGTVRSVESPRFGVDYWEVAMNETSSQTPSASDVGDKLILASRVLKTNVYNKAGDHIGHIDDLSIDRITGRTKYAIVSFGGFLGIGERFHPLPWSVLDFDPAQGGYVVPLDKAALADAPHYDSDELIALGGARHQSYSDFIGGYYGRYGTFSY